MQEIYIENLLNVINYKKKLEKELGIVITNKGKNVFIEGPAENEFIALKVLEAINLDFSIDRALILKDENQILQTINLKDLTKRDIHHVKSRLIGTHGKTLSTLNNLTDCAISLKDHTIGIIGDAELIDEAILAIKSIIQGSKLGNVYARLEREMKKKRENPIDKSSIKNELKRKKKF